MNKIIYIFLCCITLGLTAKNIEYSKTNQVSSNYMEELEVDEPAMQSFTFTWYRVFFEPWENMSLSLVIGCLIGFITFLLRIAFVFGSIFICVISRKWWEVFFVCSCIICFTVLYRYTIEAPYYSYYRATIEAPLLISTSLIAGLIWNYKYKDKKEKLFIDL